MKRLALLLLSLHSAWSAETTPAAATPAAAAQPSTPAAAAQKEEKELVVTATRTGQDPHVSPYIIHQLGAAQFDQRQFRSIPESLRETPSVMVQKTSNGQGSPYLRGFTGFRTLAMVDGIRFNNSTFRDGPNQYWNTIDGLAMEGMELVLGQGSVLYGSDAIGGTINLLTKHSHYEDEAAGQFFIHGDTLQRWSSAEQSWVGRVETRLGVGQEWGLHLGGSMKQFGDIRAAELGTQRHTGYDEWAYDARLDVKLDEQWDLTLAHQALQQDEAWRTHSTIYGVSFAGTEVGSDLRRAFDQERSLSYLKLRGEDLKGFIQRMTLTLSYQNSLEEQDRVKKDGKGELSGVDLDTYGVDLQLESDSPIGSLVYGIDYYRDSADSFRRDLKPGGALDKVRIQGPVADDSSYELFGAYLQDDITLTDRVHLLVGGRYTRAQADLGRYEDPVSKTAKSFSDSWDEASFSARVIADLDKEQHFKLFGGVSQGFRAPNLSDLSRLDIARSNELEVANTNLDPEQFINYEIGVKARTGSFTGSLSYFYTDIHDMIMRQPTGRTVNDSMEVSKANGGEGHVHGFELGAQWQLCDQWSVFGNLTWMEGEADAYPTSANQRVREPLSKIMPLTGTAGVRWTAPSQKLWTELVWISTARADRLNSGDLADVQRIPAGGTPGYHLVTLRAGWQVQQNVQLLASLDNILDEAYRVHGSGSNEPGFGATLGVKVSF